MNNKEARLYDDLLKPSPHSTVGIVYIDICNKIIRYYI